MVRFLYPSSHFFSSSLFPFGSHLNNEENFIVNSRMLIRFFLLLIFTEKKSDECANKCCHPICGPISYKQNIRKNIYLIFTFYLQKEEDEKKNRNTSNSTIRKQTHTIRLSKKRRAGGVIRELKGNSIAIQTIQ